MNKRNGFAIALAFAGILLLANMVWGSAGDQLWETKFSFLPNYQKVTINAVAVSQSTLIICGTAYPGGLIGIPLQIGFIKAFNVTTGVIAWEKELTIGPSYNNFTAINLLGDIVVTVGYSSGNIPAGGSINKGVLQAYSATTGQLLWEVERDSYLGNLSTPLDSLPTLPVMAAGNYRSFLIFKETNPAPPGGTTGYWIVQAFQVKDVTVDPFFLLLLDK